jgi:pectate lyase
VTGRWVRRVVAVAAVISCTAAAGSASSSASSGVSSSLRSLSRQTLPAGDGWGSAGSGTTGGAAATSVSVVSSRSELVSALGVGTAAAATPKIIFVRGRIDGNVDAADHPLSCADYAAGTGYQLSDYLTAFDPATWGRTIKPTGPAEDARALAAAKQAAQVQIPVSANTTVIGVGDTARIVGANLLIKSVDNVIVRNIAFSDAADCFPKWDPTDGAEGNWNSAYDSITLSGATHVWLDHNSFTDRPNLDALQPSYFGRPYQVHDGASDIIKGSDFVTVSWNRYYDHDKTMLIGSTNTPTDDLGKLRVTLHHNEFDTILQRAPRVRFGQVDVYDNDYRIPADSGYVYSWGVGVGSALVAEKNSFRLGAGVDPAQVIYNWGGTAIRADDNWVSVGGKRAAPVDLLAAFNAASDPDLGDDVGWAPTLRTTVLPAPWVARIVPALAGAGRIGGHG